MKYITLFCLICLPSFALTAETEIDALKSEVRELRELNALYVARIQAIEERLAGLERGDTDIQSAEVQTSSLASADSETFGQNQRDEVSETGVKTERDQFSTGFDPDLFDFYGYLRAGFGVDKNGTAQERFVLPGSSATYRLGNENDTYMETGFSYHHVNREQGADTPVFGTHFRIAYSSLEKSLGVDLGGEVGQTSLREVYANARNVIASKPDASIWAGQRFYRRHDIHINDFFWLDMSGFGGGIEDVDLGFADMSVAWIGGTIDDFTGTNDFIGDLQDTDKNNIDFRLNNMDLGIGRGNLWAVYSHYELKTDLIERDADGLALGFWLVSDLSEDSSNMAVFQYGTGVAANFNSFSPSLRATDDGDIPIGTSVEDQRRLRLMNVLTYTFNPHWSMQGVAIYQQDDLGLPRNTDVKWYSLGVRPIYSFNSLYNLAFEISYDYSEIETGQEGGLFKFTIAPELTPDWGFFSRPALRAYFTYAAWSDDYRGMIGGTTYAEDTEGISVGVQVESWW